MIRLESYRELFRNAHKIADLLDPEDGSSLADRVRSGAEDLHLDESALRVIVGVGELARDLLRRIEEAQRP